MTYGEQHRSKSQKYPTCTKTNVTIVTSLYTCFYDVVQSNNRYISVRLLHEVTIVTSPYTHLLPHVKVELDIGSNVIFTHVTVKNE